MSTKPFRGLSRLLLVPTLFMAALILSACGGGDDDGAEATPGAGGSTPGADLPISLLMDLNSYKYTLSITGNGGPVAGLIGTSDADGIEISGAYIKPDRQQVTLKLGADSLETIIANGQLWTLENGAVVAGPTAVEEFTLRRANPLLAFWDGGPLREIIREFDCEAATSTVNGVEARRCSVGQDGYVELTKTWGDFLGGMVHQSYSKAGAEVWLAKNGYPVRMRLDIAGKDQQGANFDYQLEMDLSDVNGTFVINPPQ